MADVPDVEVEIVADGDVVRGERLVRSLLQELAEADGLRVQPPGPDYRAGGDGSKGVTDHLADASIWVFLTVGARSGAKVLIAALHAWQQREKHRTVRLKRGNLTIEVPAGLTPAQERAIEAFLSDDER